MHYPLWPRFFKINASCGSSYRRRAPWQGINSTRFYVKPLRTIRTLDPTRLSQSDFIDLSNRTGGRIRSLSADSSHLPSMLSFKHSDGKATRFPSNTKGFLYFVPAPHPSVQLASEIRFRITRDHDVSSFPGGSDLLLPDFTPWRIPLVALARRSVYLGLRELLLREGLVTTLSLSHCAALKYSMHRSTSVIHSFGQIFSLDFRETQPRFLFTCADSMHPIYFDHRGTYHVTNKTAPYTGSALCCFERSTLLSHKGTRTLVMRVKKITSPIKTLISEYDDWVLKPQEGQLVMHKKFRRRNEPWSFDIDKKGKAAALQGLFRDN